MSTETEPLRREILVVTGASTGIGAATARELARRGFHVLAGVRRGKDADALRATNLEPIMLDITNEAEIAALVKHITDDPERRPLRALVNNAGIGVNAPVETLPLSEWRRLFDINLFGHVAMMQALLPALIESRGTVVNVSSVGGKLAMATYGPYAGSKFALEAVSDALRREVEPLGVKVVVIEPGAVTSEMLGRVADHWRAHHQRNDHRAAWSLRQAHACNHLAGPGSYPQRQRTCRGRQVESSPTRSPASGLVLATPLVATRRSSSVSLGSSQTGCSTAFSPAVSSRISLKLHRRRERAASDARAPCRRGAP